MGEKMHILQIICGQFDIMLLYLFGSQQTNALQILQEKPVSVTDPLTDIDIGVVFSRPLSHGRERVRLYSKIFNQLEDLFTPYKLDLVFLEENNSVFQAEAVKGICVYAASPEVKDTYEEDILRRACDFKPYLDQYYQELLEDLK